LVVTVRRPDATEVLPDAITLGVGAGDDATGAADPEDAGVALNTSAP
jgi:hypothetical protein